MSYNHIDNTTFLQALFGNAWEEVHVNSFMDDPSAIANDRRGICWATNHYGPWATAGGLPEGNQYFDIATFYRAEDGTIRRRKALYLKCHVFVLDDVAEKIPEELARLLPPPTWILQTSADSYQWGYKLNPALAGRFMDYLESEVCNAQDILIGSDLVPSGRDPGMRGVTRLVRLPEGINTKASRLVDGWLPFKCKLTYWNPDAETTLEAIIAPFKGEGDSLDMVRNDAVIGDQGQLDVEGHPVLDLLSNLTRVGVGEYKAMCPFTDNHTEIDYSNTDAIIYTKEHGKAAMKCHHGGCADKGLRALMAWSHEQEGFTAAYDLLRANESADQFRQALEASSSGDGGQDMAPVPSHPEWSSGADILANVVTITEGKGGYFNKQSRGFISASKILDATYAHLTDGVLPSTWLRTMHDKLTAQGMGWHPCSQGFIDLNGRRLANSYRPPHIVPVQNDALLEAWLYLCNYIYGKHADLVLDHMAFTLQHPEIKIRWQILTIGAPRTGKTMSLEPLNLIMGDSATVVSKDNSGEAWGDVFARAKVVIYEEIDHNINFDVLKPRLANSGLEHLNIKGQGYLVQMNLYSMYMFSNKSAALQFESDQDKLLVIQAPTEKLDELTFYKPLGQQIERSAEFLSAAYYHLLNRDVTAFQYFSLPERTEAMYAMCKATRNQAVTALLEAMETASGPFGFGVVKIEEVRKWLSSNTYRMSQNKEIGDAMREGGWDHCHGVRRVGGKVAGHRFWAPVAATENLSSRELFDLYAQATGAPF